MKPRALCWLGTARRDGTVGSVQMLGAMTGAVRNRGSELTGVRHVPPPGRSGQAGP